MEFLVLNHQAIFWSINLYSLIICENDKYAVFWHLKRILIENDFFSIVNKVKMYVWLKFYKIVSL